MKNIILVILAIVIISSVEEITKCGGNYGSCPPGYCCSSWDWCGTSDDYCLLSFGCQPQFGECRGNEDEKVDPEEPFTTDGRCGPGVGKCSIGACCSKWGSCGYLDDHCLISKGCQRKYGTCKDDQPNNDDQKPNNDDDQNQDDDDQNQDDDDDQNQNNDDDQNQNNDDQNQNNDDQNQNNDDDQNQNNDDQNQNNDNQNQNNDNQNQNNDGQGEDKKDDKEEEKDEDDEDDDDDKDDDDDEEW